MNFLLTTVLLLPSVSFYQASLMWRNLADCAGTESMKNREPRKLSACATSEEIVVKAGREVSIEGLKIRFESVTDDSRCPQGVDCIWSGNAEAVFKVKATSGEVATVKLNTNLDPKEALCHGYRIKLARLDPYPKKDQRIASDQYQAALIVSKK
jgi:hypothetical protein